MSDTLIPVFFNNEKIYLDVEKDDLIQALHTLGENCWHTAIEERRHLHIPSNRFVRYTCTKTVYIEDDVTHVDFTISDIEYESNVVMYR